MNRDDLFERLKQLVFAGHKIGWQCDEWPEDGLPLHSSNEANYLVANAEKKFPCVGLASNGWKREHRLWWTDEPSAAFLFDFAEYHTKSPNNWLGMVTEADYLEKTYGGCIVNGLTAHRTWVARLMDFVADFLRTTGHAPKTIEGRNETDSPRMVHGQFTSSPAVRLVTLDLLDALLEMKDELRSKVAINSTNAQTKHEPRMTDEVRTEEPPFTKEVLELRNKIVLNAIADCDSALKSLETLNDRETFDEKARISNALHAIKKYSSLEEHSEALAKTRRLRLDSDRSNPKHWLRIDSLLRSIFGSNLTEIELYERWENWLLLHLKNSYQAVPYWSWDSEEKQKRIKTRLVLATETVEIPQDLQGRFGSIDPYLNVLLAFSIDEAVAFTNGVVLETRRKLQHDDLAMGTANAIDPKQLVGSKYDESSTLENFPELNTTDGSWILATSNVMCVDFNWKTSTLRTSRYQSPLKSKEGKYGISEKGFVWRVDPYDSKAVWYLRSSLTRNMRPGKVSN